jgi:fructose 1,6-bisphosphate aldolase/phosphatase
LAEGVIFDIMGIMNSKIADLKMWQDKAELKTALEYPGNFITLLGRM